MTRAMRVPRLFLFAFIVYVVLDLGCPLVPGAFSFDPDDSVDAVSACRARPCPLPRLASMPAVVMAVPGPAPHALRGGDVAPSLVMWRPHAGRDQRLAAEPRPPIEDD